MFPWSTSSQEIMMLTSLVPEDFSTCGSLNLIISNIKGAKWNIMEIDLLCVSVLLILWVMFPCIPMVGPSLEDIYFCNFLANLLIDWVWQINFCTWLKNKFLHSCDMDHQEMLRHRISSFMWFIGKYYRIDKFWILWWVVSNGCIACSIAFNHPPILAVTNFQKISMS